MTILAIIFLSQSCSYIQQDPVNPQLNKYTETGENTAGALVNGMPWNTKLQIAFWSEWKQGMYFVNYVDKDSLILAFTSDHSSMVFSLKGLKITEFGNFESLKGKKIILDGVKTYGSFVTLNNNELYTNYPFPPGTGKGQIYFKNIKYTPDALIISGGFSFKEESKNTTVSYGRFDYTLSKSIFENSKIQ